MKKTSVLLVLSVAVLLGGCSSEPAATADDKANLERLHKEGIGKVMADQMAREGKKPPEGGVSLANPTGGPGPDAP